MTDAMRTLDAVEVRVLGALVEKATTTPDQYPLSLNALRQACNQKTSRFPTTQYSEQEVYAATQRLINLGLAVQRSPADSRVARYEHRSDLALDLRKREMAVICALLLRGALTPGEIRQASQRLHDFDDLDQVLETLAKLGRHEPPRVRALQREPGQKEGRYEQLLGVSANSPRSSGSYAAEAAQPNNDLIERLEALEAKVAEIEQQLGLESPVNEG